jgi:hypothetical protein
MHIQRRRCGVKFRGHLVKPEKKVVWRPWGLVNLEGGFGGETNPFEVTEVEPEGRRRQRLDSHRNRGAIGSRRKRYDATVRDMRSPHNSRYAQPFVEFLRNRRDIQHQCSSTEFRDELPHDQGEAGAPPVPKVCQYRMFSCYWS